MVANKPTKYSHQREAIITFLASRKDHPTADEVYQNIKEIIPNISLGTVYRNLKQLSESGSILRLTCDGKTDHFDACTKPHYHFLCKCCGGVKDIPMEPMIALIDEATSCTDFKIEEANVLFTGLCDLCKN
ncbi:MAG: transcriptional repressor [Lachnospiraceae bacterium]|nr:transcriptional repressor [Lachnospiraceae bacterium]